MVSVPKVIFLQEAEFSGWLVRPKNYKNGLKNIFGLLVVLELKVENSTILTFKVIFLRQKLTESFSSQPTEVDQYKKNLLNLDNSIVF